MAERWRAVVGYEGSYEVSDLGRVRSLDRVDRTGHPWRGRVLKLHAVSARGYRKVTLYRDGSGSQRLVHRLVLEAFVGPCPEGMEGCHGEGGNTNNALTNIRWDTSSENNFDIVRQGNHHHAKKTKCKRGHLLAGANLTGGAVAKRGWRRCKACARESDHARNHHREFSPELADIEYLKFTRAEHS